MATAAPRIGDTKVKVPMSLLEKDADTKLPAH
jgi:hypothetical protein